MAQAVSTSFRVDPAVKTAFYQFCNEVGMTPSVAVNMFMTRTVLDQRLPFEVTTHSDPGPYQKFWKENELSPAYDTVADVRAALDAED